MLCITMRPIAVDVVWSVGLCVCLLDASVSPAKVDEPIEMPSGLWTRVGPRNLDIHKNRDVSATV